ncbi:RidA family protein [Amphibacillus jilinensis]|uniref:RidA family protein n=1 Tax=Amphibacillus jilinensis TaxID=1216008 RepID=UPI0003061A7B|nr:RidA family protein [Amphibacillus jilinensis]
MKVVRNPQDVHNPVAAYVHQIEVTGPQQWLTLSGQLGMAADGRLPEDPIEQLQIALDNIKKNLRAANMEITDLTKLVFYLVGDIDTDKRREVVSQFLGDHIPCTTMLYVVALAAPNFKVEIDAWACRDI